MSILIFFGTISLTCLILLMIKHPRATPYALDREKSKKFLKRLDYVIVISVLSWVCFDMAQIRIFGYGGLALLIMTGMSSVLVYALIMKWSGIKFFERPIGYSLSIILYLFLGISFVPYLNYLIVFLTLNPALGLERKIIDSNAKYVFERQDLVEGGRYNYALYEKHYLYDKLVKKYYGPSEEYDLPQFLDSIE